EEAAGVPEEAVPAGVHLQVEGALERAVGELEAAAADLAHRFIQVAGGAVADAAGGLAAGLEEIRRGEIGVRHDAELVPGAAAGVGRQAAAEDVDPQEDGDDEERGGEPQLRTLQNRTQGRRSPV